MFFSGIGPWKLVSAKRLAHDKLVVTVQRRKTLRTRLISLFVWSFLKPKQYMNTGFMPSLNRTSTDWYYFPSGKKTEALEIPLDWQQLSGLYDQHILIKELAEMDRREQIFQNGKLFDFNMDMLRAYDCSVRTTNFVQITPHNIANSPISLKEDAVFMCIEQVSRRNREDPVGENPDNLGYVFLCGDKRIHIKNENLWMLKLAK